MLFYGVRLSYSRPYSSAALSRTRPMQLTINGNPARWPRDRDNA
nr:hypothetical protein [Verrucomicrobium spinosum]